MAKRSCDALLAASGLIFLSPLLAVIAVLVYLCDRHNPFYLGQRVGRYGSLFRMVKFRSMRPDAWKTLVNSTAAGDKRITWIGGLLRRSKLDELPQLWNVFAGHMSLVGPRPQVPADASLYTEVERKMLAVRPGITDLASIIFADEGEILSDCVDPDLRYNQVIRPWKSRLALLYVERHSLHLDFQIIRWTLLALLSRKRAIAAVGAELERWGCDPLLRRMAGRREPLLEYPPPGASEVVARYQVTSA